MFKIPSNIPQDLLLIHDLVSEPVPGPSSLKAGPRGRSDESSESSSESDSIASSSNSESSDSESDSDEANVVESLLTDADISRQDGDIKPRSPSESDSDTSSESDTDKDDPIKSIGKQALNDFEEDEDEGGGRVGSGATPRTKNEISDPSVLVPDITEIDAREPLERVGEIMSIFEDTVVVKGVASGNEHRASMGALDSESLLVFEDRKVLGFVYETFGPTHQPLYQVKFPSAGSIDRDIVRVSREVFHVPPRSHFVFPSQLSKMKGSDASNVHDEEVSEDEIEFSDDEAEAAYRQQRKRKRAGFRESSLASSRFSTPTPSQMRDQEVNDDAFYGTSPYDEYGPYDVGVASGPSRPAPLPYDDPYQDEMPSSTSYDASALEEGPSSPKGRRNFFHGNSRDQGHGRGRGRGRGRDRGRGREGGGRGGFDHRGPNGQGTSGGASFERRDRRPSFSRSGRSQVGSPRSFSPTSMAIARATGQYSDGSIFASQEVPPSSYSPNGSWQQQNFSHEQPGDTSYQTFSNRQTQFTSQQAYAQPHINPRFAPLFGIDVNHMQGQQYNSLGVTSSSLTSPYTPYSPNSSWRNSTWTSSTSEGNGQPRLPESEYVVQTKTENDEYRP